MLSPSLFVTYSFGTAPFGSAPVAAVTTRANPRTTRPGLRILMTTAPSRPPTQERVQPRAEHVRASLPRPGLLPEAVRSRSCEARGNQPSRESNVGSTPGESTRMTTPWAASDPWLGRPRAYGPGVIESPGPALRSPG